MPTIVPKSSVSEVTGLVVLLDAHKGSEDIARLADDLDLEIDEILPSVDYAEVLDLLTVEDGRATLTEAGRRFLKSTIRGRKSIIRDQLSRTTLFRTLLRALESAPERTLGEDDIVRLIELTSAPSNEVIQNILNWGRYAELFRYDADERTVTAIRHLPPRQPPASGKTPPDARPSRGVADPPRAAARPAGPEEKSAPLASANA